MSKVVKLNTRRRQQQELTLPLTQEMPCFLEFCVKREKSFNLTMSVFALFRITQSLVKFLLYTGAVTVTVH